MTNPDRPERNNTTAATLMDPHPTIVKPTDLISTAIEHVMTHRYRHLPVVDEEGRYLGIFGVNCLLRLVLPKAAIMEQGLSNVSFIYETVADLHDRLRGMAHEPISTCMRTDISTVYPDTPLVETLLNLYNSKSCVPVVERETRKLAGMISYFDVGERILSA